MPATFGRSKHFAAYPEAKSFAACPEAHYLTGVHMQAITCLGQGLFLRRRG